MYTFDALPDCVTVDGREYKVLTDFMDWCWFDAIWFEDELGDEEKVIASLQMFADEIPGDIEAAFAGLLWFYGGGDKPEQSQKRASTKRVIDFTHDAPYILSTFFRCVRH